MTLPRRANAPTATTSGTSDHAAFRAALRRAAPALARPLPWIGDERPWAILVSEVMLQQTQVTRVVEPWTLFMERFPTPSSCAEASLAEVLRAWTGLGYNRRAKALHDAARVLRDEYDDAVPREVELLRRLPGVGEYTAAAVACFAYGESIAVLDSNVGRILARALANRTLGRAEARTLATALVPGRSPSAFNQAMLDLGAQFCRASPRCDACPLAGQCRWHRQGGADPALHSAGVSRPQSPFEGSNRQLRGRMLSVLREGPHSRRRIGERLVGVEPGRCDEALDALVHDGLVTQIGQRYSLRE